MGTALRAGGGGPVIRVSGGGGGGRSRVGLGLGLGLGLTGGRRRGLAFVSGEGRE